MASTVPEGKDRAEAPHWAQPGRRQLVSGITPEEIDTAFRPKFRNEVAVVPVEDEAVLYEEDHGALHQLDRIATIVCSYFDGRTALADAIEELSGAFGAPAEVIEADVLALARELGAKGLLVGVAGTPVDEGLRHGE